MNKASTICISLPPFPFRGVRAPYLWMFYKILSSTVGPKHFLVHEDYIEDPIKWANANRWEVRKSTLKRLEYEVPSAAALEHVNYSCAKNQMFHSLLSEAGGNPLKAFEIYICESRAFLEEYFSVELAKLSDSARVDAVLTPINCAALRHVCSEMSIPMIHFELGPLRAPAYLDLTYFDFKGLNEHSEFTERYHKYLTSREGTDLQSLPETRQLFMNLGWWEERQTQYNATFDVAVPLQVEDDTNLLASSNGFSNQALIACAKVKFAGRRVVTKAHPGSAFMLKEEVEPENRSQLGGTDMLLNCDHVLTINSSMGFEGVLWGKNVTLLGKAAYKPLLDCEDKSTQEEAIKFYLYHYLVPFDLVFSRQYIDFRLSQPHEDEIKLVHLSHLVKLRARKMAAQGQ